MSENEYFLDSRMCWMASWTAGSIPRLMLLITADSFIGMSTMMGKFSPSLANQLLSCPCLVRSLHTLARAGWNSRTHSSRHPVERTISQPLQPLRAGAIATVQGDQVRSHRALTVWASQNRAPPGCSLARPTSKSYRHTPDRRAAAAAAAAPQWANSLCGLRQTGENIYIYFLIKVPL